MKYSMICCVIINDSINYKILSSFNSHFNNKFNVCHFKSIFQTMKNVKCTLTRKYNWPMKLLITCIIVIANWTILLYLLKSSVHFPVIPLNALFISSTLTVLPLFLMYFWRLRPQFIKEDTKGVIIIRKSMQDRQHNGKKKKDKQRSKKHRHKTKDRVTRTQQ
jgi:phosphoglycerol transferase MdoB-like AlkP superfamily enzyme